MRKWFRHTTFSGLGYALVCVMKFTTRSLITTHLWDTTQVERCSYSGGGYSATRHPQGQRVSSLQSNNKLTTDGQYWKWPLLLSSKLLYLTIAHISFHSDAYLWWCDILWSEANILWRCGGHGRNDLQDRSLYTSADRMVRNLICQSITIWSFIAPTYFVQIVDRSFTLFVFYKV